MRYFDVAGLLFALLICIQPVKAQKKLVIIGSSTSACYVVDPTTQCFVGRVYSYYNTTSPFDTTVDNSLTVSGYNVYRAMPTSYVPPYPDSAYQPNPSINITAAIAKHPDVILVNFPTNAYNVLPFDSIMYCLRTIRDSANKAHIPCFVTTTQPRTSSGYNTPATKLKLAILRDSILHEFGSFAINFYDGLVDLTDSSILAIYRALPDGTNPDYIHYNAAGHAILAQRVEAANVFSASSLPATFLNYDASYSNNTTLITWSAAKEVQVADYEIDRSADGISFTPLGKVDPNNGAGTYNYRFTDQQPLKGWSYYKVLIVDQDGKKEASPVLRAFDNAGKLAVRKIVTQTTQVMLELQSSDAENAGLQVVNSLGQLVQTGARHIDTGISTLTINTASFGTGIYYIKLTTATGTPIITPFLKQ